MHNEILNILNHEVRLDTVERGLTRVRDRIEWLEKQIDTDLTDLEDRLTGKIDQITEIVDVRLQPIEALARGQDSNRKWLVGLALTIILALFGSVAWINYSIGTLDTRSLIYTQTVQEIKTKIEKVEAEIRAEIKDKK